ncbi:MAG: hypothetical protein M3Q64_02230 [bacterium]|nr:hypothetical protein [bacterium]
MHFITKTPSPDFPVSFDICSICGLHGHFKNVKDYPREYYLFEPAKQQLALLVFEGKITLPKAQDIGKQILSSNIAKTERDTNPKLKNFCSLLWLMRSAEIPGIPECLEEFFPEAVPKNEVTHHFTVQ